MGAAASLVVAAPCAATPLATNNDSLAATLARGSGTVVLDKDGFEGVHLWRTPGVRGNWVEGGPVASGESVELLSPPQPSEGEGDFVYVRSARGQEGWTKVKNVRLKRASDK